MKPWYRVIFSLWIAAMAWPSAKAAIGEEQGIIIVLHTSFQFCPYAPLDHTVVVVAEDEELKVLRQSFSSGSEDIYIALQTEAPIPIGFGARVSWVDSDHLSGVGALSGIPIEVVNRSYAKRRGWLPKEP